MANKNMKSIGIWGPSKSGKTTYLTSAIAYMKSKPTEWHLVECGSEGHDSKIDTRLIPDLRKGLFPPGTDYLDPEEVRPYHYSITHKKRIFGNKEFEFRVFDIPGQWVGLEDKRSESLFSYLAQCGGIIALIDPGVQKSGEAIFGDKGKGYDHIVSELLSGIRRYREETNEKHYIALCISKCDLDQNYIYLDNPEEYLRTIISPETWGDIINTFRRNYRVFCISSIGRYSTPAGHIKPNIVFDTADHIDRIPYPDKREPINLIEPLLWLFEKA